MSRQSRVLTAGVRGAMDPGHEAQDDDGGCSARGGCLEGAASDALPPLDILQYRPHSALDNFDAQDACLRRVSLADDGRQ